ncbi:FecR family protein [Tenacibaculum sp. C7A-26P2]|uniref:FecR family protein n=1 Tax=Tenacibaculum sp. C7A-26P2 TaxID=3447504 RepID=UPI003F834800
MTQKEYTNINDFINDCSFKNWALNNQLSDVYFWDFWLKCNPSKKDIVYEARDIIIGINFKKDVIPEEKIDFEWSKLENRLKKVKSPIKKKRPFLNKRDKYLISGIAASFLLLISVSSWYFYSDFMKVTHKTSFGEVLELKLSDGTLVTLNSNSTISYKKNNAREVWLKGEAFFNVSKKRASNAKFWVNTKDLTVEVFGTQFNVNTQKNKTKVFLEEGSVKLSLNNGLSKNMVPGNYIEYSSHSKKIIVDDHLNSGYDQVAWKNGKLIFINSTLSDALEKVSETYGVNFDFIDEKTKKILITGTVPTTNLEICLNAVKKAANITIKEDNKKLIVYKNY